MAASALKAIEVLEQQPALVERLWKNTAQMRSALREIGFEIVVGQIPIIPILTRDTFKTMMFSKRLFENGVFAPGIGYPVVPEGRARIRVQVSAALSEENIQRAISIFEKVGKEINLI